MLVYRAASTGTPAAAWALIAEPRHWSRWAPHIRGAVGLGRPEVQAGRRGAVLVGFGAPVPARISAKTPGREWEWTTGPVQIRHRVEATPEGCEIVMEVSAPGALEPLLGALYGPVIRWVSGRLARLAEAPRTAVDAGRGTSSG